MENEWREKKGGALHGEGTPLEGKGASGDPIGKQGGFGCNLRYTTSIPQHSIYKVSPFPRALVSGCDHGLHFSNSCTMINDNNNG